MDLAKHDRNRHLAVRSATLGLRGWLALRPDLGNEVRDSRLTPGSLSVSIMRLRRIHNRPSEGYKPLGLGANKLSRGHMDWHFLCSTGNGKAS